MACVGSGFVGISFVVIIDFGPECIFFTVTIDFAGVRLPHAAILHPVKTKIWSPSPVCTYETPLFSQTLKAQANHQCYGPCGA